jgi:hypothetical protein
VIEYKTREDNSVLLTFALGGIGDVLGDRVQDKRRQLYYLLLPLVVLVMF